MDTLSRLLSLYTIRTALDIRCELAAPWVLDEPPATPGVAPFHVIVEGTARVDAPGHPTLELAAGDVVVFPGGSAHRLHAGPAESLTPASAAGPLPADGPLRRKGNGGAGPGTVILCGSFTFEGAARQALVRALPDVMVVRASRADDFPGLHALVQLLQHETAVTRPGGDVVVAQLSGALFALLLRAWLAGGDAAAPGLFALLADRRLGGALHRMLESPEQAWKVEDLADACHMSRATFARLFTRLCGMPPADLLTQLRMARAARALLAGEGAVGDVALAVGYQSEAAFNRVFKRHYGIGPGGYRRAAQTAST